MSTQAEISRLDLMVADLETIASSQSDGVQDSTIVGKQNPERHTFISTNNELMTSTSVRLVGTSFDGTNKDPNFWTETLGEGGSNVQAGGEIILKTGTDANGTVKYESVRKARYVVGQPLMFRGYPRFVTAGTADNIRRIGAYNATDGFFFQLNGTTFQIGTRKSSSDTLVSSGSFNGNMGTTFTPLTTVRYSFMIEYTTFGAYWYVNDELLHKIEGQNLTATMTLPITTENLNSNDSIVDVEMHNYGSSIERHGELITDSTYKYIGTDATTVCKYGAGRLHNVTVLDNAGRIIVYDGLSAAGTVISNIDSAQGSEPMGTLEFNVPFSDGLTIVTSSSARCTVTYE